MSTTVSPDKILHELADLWITLGKPGEGDPTGGVLRACSMTLLVMTEDAGDPMDLGETIAALMPEHPARAIVIRLLGQDGRSLAARVFSQCWMPFGQRRQICCEQVEITATDASFDDLPAVVLPLCVPDLPVILWCRSGRLVGHPAFRQVTRMAHKVIVDSASVGSARAALPLLAAATNKGMFAADLAWTRLTRWRESLSRVFENREFQARLGELSRVQVCYGGAEPPAAAYYMGAWLVDSLDRAGVHAAVHFEADPNVPAGGIGSVHLAGASDTALHVTLAARAGALTVQVNGLANCTALPDSTEYLLLREELGIVRRDPVFEGTLSSAARLAVSSLDK